MQSSVKRRLYKHIFSLWPYGGYIYVGCEFKLFLIEQISENDHGKCASSTCSGTVRTW